MGNEQWYDIIKIQNNEKLKMKNVILKNKRSLLYKNWTLKAQPLSNPLQPKGKKQSPKAWKPNATHTKNSSPKACYNRPITQPPARRYFPYFRSGIRSHFLNTKCFHTRPTWYQNCLLEHMCRPNRWWPESLRLH